MHTFYAWKYCRQVTTSNRMEKKFVRISKVVSLCSTFSQEAKLTIYIVGQKFNRWLSRWVREKLVRVAYVACFTDKLKMSESENPTLSTKKNGSKRTSIIQEMQNFKTITFFEIIIPSYTILYCGKICTPTTGISKSS